MIGAVMICTKRNLGVWWGAWLRHTRAAILGLSGMSAVLGGCSGYDHRYVFLPGPIDVEAAVPGVEGVEPARTLVSVVGVRKADPKAGLPESVEVRLRVENTSPVDIRFDPASLQLVSAGLERFPDPIVQPMRGVTLAPGESAQVDAWFPFRADERPTEMDLSGLNLRWTIVIEGQRVTSSASFQRRPDAYYDRYQHRVGVGFQGHYREPPPRTTDDG